MHAESVRQSNVPSAGLPHAFSVQCCQSWLPRALPWAVLPCTFGAFPRFSLVIGRNNSPNSGGTPFHPSPPALRGRGDLETSKHADGNITTNTSTFVGELHDEVAALARVHFRRRRNPGGR